MLVVKHSSIDWDNITPEETLNSFFTVSPDNKHPKNIIKTTYIDLKKINSKRFNNITNIEFWYNDFVNENRIRVYEGTETYHFSIKPYIFFDRVLCDLGKNPTSDKLIDSIHNQINQIIDYMNIE